MDLSSTTKVVNSVIDLKAGVARIKAEFVLTGNDKSPTPNTLPCQKEEDLNNLEVDMTDETTSNQEPPNKKQCYLSRKEKRRGQNKSRPPPFKLSRESRLCPVLQDVPEDEPWPECKNEKCTFIHNVPEYISSKLPDIGPVCYLYSVNGHCPRGQTCRFGSQHLTKEGKNCSNKSCNRTDASTINFLTKELQADLRKRRYDFSKSENIITSLDKMKQKKAEVRSGARKVDGQGNETKLEEKQYSNVKMEVDDHIPDQKGTNENNEVEDKMCGPVLLPDLALKREKKELNWQNKLYLAPLTTVGNLPFRRICKELGADITCGEMAMASSLLQATQQEWALVKRHESEKLFGVQLCGNNPYVMTRCTQLLEEQMSINFIDVNLGCPIELVYQQGGGSGLLRREKVLESVVRSMSNVTNLPLTIKTRTGVYTDKNIAHTLVPKFRDWGASLITVHGRSREQRYTRNADWNYIETCAKLASPTPVFGNGDILSYEDYERVSIDYPSIKGVMIGRGALIKPWLFTEIKEKRHWDISSSERLDILRKYVNYGLEHWGSDTKGVENTRRFLLEWLSFLYRYIPVGLLEEPPQKINQRPPGYRGRDDLETLMASANCTDWIKISEMILGPVPENFLFLPKHKANSWN
uniref:tRNA-dihydrouridine(47) synthase [NAD(P)(+)] n=1 Tax=Timema californicum TaxID=61474 RepID=A0A7R9J891_TIMCA|nr:unnamed protein product [Timema californicum]